MAGLIENGLRVLANMADKFHVSYVDNKLKRCLGAVALCLLFALPVPLYGEVIIAIHDWDTTGSGSWGAQDGDALV